jgi:hypothetical protein
VPWFYHELGILNAIGMALILPFFIYFLKAKFSIDDKNNSNYLGEEPAQNQDKKDTIRATQQKTDPFAIIAFAAGLGGFVVVPIFFVPVGYIAAIVSYYRLKENEELKGKGLRIVGAIFTTLNIFWLMYQYKIGVFAS